VRALIVSGIWPPDVGGPASHAPEVASWLAARGHDVEAVITADRAPAPERYRVHWVSRSLPPGLRHAEAVRVVAARSRRADVVYATGMHGRSALATRATHVPLVLKLTSDPAFERARRRGVVGGAVADFQNGGGGVRANMLRAARDATVRRAAHVVCPSTFMADLAVFWGVPRERVSVLPNPAPDPAEAVAATLGQRPALVFAGRLTDAKNLDLALRALGAVPEARLTIVGDGPDRARLERVAAELGANAEFVGARPRGEVLGLMAAADAVVLSSAWENFPHGVVEALAMGTPVVATRVGGVPEVVRDGENGLLVDPGDVAELGGALQRILGDEGLRSRVAANAAPSVARYSADAIYGRLEQILERAAS
jgi:glycosyltransferase involved in cell wall biosynthesis